MRLEYPGPDRHGSDAFFKLFFQLVKKNVEILFSKKTKDHLFYIRFTFHVFNGRGKHVVGAPFERKTENTGADGRQSHAF